MTDTVKVEIRTYPEFTTSGNQMVCEGDQVVLSASGGTKYQWLPASKVNNPTTAITNAIISGTTSSYSVNNISEDVCNYDTTIAMTIVMNPNPEISILKSNDQITLPSAGMGKLVVYYSQRVDIFTLLTLQLSAARSNEEA